MKIATILKEDRPYTKQEIQSFSTEIFDDIDKQVAKMDPEAQEETLQKAQEILQSREDSIAARYVQGAIALQRRPHEDSVVMQNLLLTFYDHHNWPAVEKICGRILALNENRTALRVLADCMEQTGREDEKWAALERLVRVDYDDRKTVRLIAERYRAKGDAEKATQYWRRALTRSMAAKDTEGVKQAWTSLIDLGQTDFGYFLGAAEKASLSVGKGPALQMLSELLPHWKDDCDKAILLLKKALEIDPANREARHELALQYRKKYAKQSRLEKCIRRSGLENPNEDVSKAIAFFETDIGFDVGCFVYQASTGRLGLIQAMNDKQVQISFGKAGKAQMSPDMAFKALTPLPKNNILVLKTAVPQKLAAKLKDDARWGLVTIMESKGNKCSFKEMKEELVPSVLNAKEWEDFKSRAKTVLSSDPYFSAVPGESDTYMMRSTPITQEEKQLLLFNSEKSFYDKVRICREFVSLDLDCESEAFGDMVRSFNFELSKWESNVDDKVLSSYLLLDLLRGQLRVATAVIDSGVSFPDLYKRIPDKVSVFDKISNAELKRAFLEKVKETDRSWADVYRDCFPHYIFSYIPTTLKNSGKENVWTGMLQRSVTNYRESVDVFIWAVRNVRPEEWKKAGVTDEDLVITQLLVLDFTSSNAALGKDVSENKKRADTIDHWLFKEKALFDAIRKRDTAFAGKVYSILANAKGIDPGRSIEVKHFIGELWPDFTFFDDSTEVIDGDSLIPMGFLCTKKALEEKIAEKDHIEHVELQEVASEIADARALGDLRENAEYQYGKDKQKNLNARLRAISDEIEKAQVITPDMVSDQKIAFGTKATLLDRLAGKDVSYTILGQWESDPDHGILNFKTPLGMKLLNKVVGDELDFDINGTRYSYEVKKIEVADF